MKKMIYLTIAATLALGATAQTVSKSGNGSVGSSGSKSSPSHAISSKSSRNSTSTNYSTSSRSGNTYTKSTSGSTKNSYSKTEKDYDRYFNSGSTYSGTSTAKGANGYYTNFVLLLAKVDKGENQPTVVVVENSTDADKKDETLKLDASDVSVVNHEDKNKDVSVTYTSNGQVGNTQTATVTDTAVFGSQDVPIAENFPSNPNYLEYQFARCGDAELDDVYYWRGILMRFENQNLAYLSECQYQFPKEVTIVITCEEFERFSDARKLHVITYPGFYDISALKCCEAYQKFIK